MPDGDLAEARRTADKLRLWREHPAQFVRDVFRVEPDPWQEAELEAFPHNQRQAFVACKGPGKLQPKSLVIDTPLGKRRWGDLKAGDLVFAEDGTPTEITKTFDNGVVPVYRVVFDDGSETLAGAEHLWKVRGHRERERTRFWRLKKPETPEVWVVLNTQQIIDRGVRQKNGRWAQRQFEIPRQGAAQFLHSEQPLDAYVLGVWIGDGSRGNGQYTGLDSEIGAEIQRRGYLLGPDDKHGKTRTVYGISGHLRALGVGRCGSHDRFIPQPYLYASVQQRIDIMRGLMDTDGCVGKDGHCEFGSTSYQLALDFIWLARSLGGVACLKPTVKRGRYRAKSGMMIECRDFHRVTVTVPFNPFIIPRKGERWKDPRRNRESERYLKRYIDRIEVAGVADSMCIQVAHPSACYLTNDFIVTHNSCLLAWLAWCFMATRPRCKLAATSLSADTLSDTLWAEMAKWRARSTFLMAKFDWQKTRITAREAPEEWFMSARTWQRSAKPEQQANTLAGLHADYIMFLIDEAGGIPDAVMAAAEAALSSCKEGHLVIAGNPTHLEGPLYRAATTERRLWRVCHITGDPNDPMRSPRVSIQWANEQIEKYGRDNAFVLVNVFGQFPPSSMNSLIGPEEVQAAMDRYYREHEIANAAKTLGIDVARFGDDSCVMFPKQGRQAFPPEERRNIDSIQGAGWVARKWDDWGADAAFIDNTGGFGSGWIDQLRALGKNPIPVEYSGSASNDRYFNKRTQMYFEAVQWIREGGALPNCPQLLAALTRTTYMFKGKKLILQPKDQVKELLGYSPDHADSFVQNFHSPVSRMAHAIPGVKRHQVEYDPFASVAAPRPDNYDPFRGM